MRFQIGDRVRRHGFLGVGIVKTVESRGCGVQWMSDGSAMEICNPCVLVAADDVLRFSLDEQVNWDERRDWWHEVAPIYQAGHSQVHCTPRILVSSYVAWDCELARVDAPPLTVEAEGDAAITCDLPHYPWQRFGAFGRWDNSFIDHISAARWYRVEHGQLSNVSQCVVTL